LVIVPTDGSDSSERAFGPACRLAERAGAGILLVGHAHTRARRAQLDHQLAERAALLRQRTTAPVGHHADASTASPASCIRAAVDAAPGSVVCMSSVGRSRTEPVMGSVAEAVLDALSAPVLLVGPNVTDERSSLEGPIVVPVDGSKDATQIVPFAAAWSTELGFAIRIVTVLPIHPDRRFERFETWEMTSHLRDLADAVRRDTGRDVECELLHGDDIGERIVDDADRGGSLVAMATHRRSTPRRVAAGSVTMRVVHRATVPVLAHRTERLPST
jgi:nucleotide-binding universal stress UspA family protein